MKRWIAFIATACALFLLGPDLVAALDLTDYRDALAALGIALLLQPWIIYQLDN